MKHIPYIVLVGIATVVMLFFYGEIPYTESPYDRWDTATYQLMAEAAPGLALGTVNKPFAYRIFGPYIAGILPGPTPVGFYIVTLSAALAVSLFFYLFLCFAGIQPIIAVLASVFFLFNKYLFGYNVWHFFRVGDLLSMVYLPVLFWAMMDRRWVIFGFTLLIGALTREVAMMMVPVAFVYLVEKGKLREEWKSFALAILPGIILYFLARYLIPVKGGSGLLEALLYKHSDKVTNLEAWFRLLINSVSPFTFLPIIFWGTTKSFFKEHKYAFVFLFLVFCSYWFGGNYERLVSPVYIFFYWLVAQIIQENLYTNRAVLLLFLVAGYLSSLHYDYARFPLVDRTITIVTSIVALGTVTTAAMIYRIKNRPPISSRVVET